MSTERKENSIDYGKIDENLNQLHEIWFEEGYLEKYRLNEEVVFNSPFEMIDYFKEIGNEEEKASAEIFEHTILDEPLGDAYLNDLKEEDEQRAERILEQREGLDSGEFWNRGIPKEFLKFQSESIKERYEKIEKELDNYNDIWFGKGYREKYRIEKGIVIKNPFEMIEYIRNNGDKEQRYAVNIFAKSFNKNPKSYEYLKKLSKNQYSEFVNSNAKVDIPNDGEGINHLSKYAIRDSQKSTLGQELDRRILKSHFENVVQNLNKYHDIWLGNGYIKKYRSESKRIFNTPFEMNEDIKRKGNDDEKYAVDIFERTLLENPIGYQYLSRLEKRDVEKYEETLDKISKENYWHTKKGAEMLNTYSFHEIDQLKNHISMDLVRNILDEYISTSNTILDTREAQERLKTLKTTLNRYFSNYTYAHLGFWSSDENVYALHKYEQLGQSLPIDTVEKSHMEIIQLGIEDCIKDSEVKEYQYEKFMSLLELFRTPGFIESNYTKLKDSFVDQLHKPSIKNDIVEGNRKYRGIGILKEIGKFAQDDDSRFQKISKEFMSGILFDKDLMSLVDTLRRYENNTKRSEERIGFTYEEILEKSLENGKYLSWDWYRKEGSNVLRKMYEYTPYMYMDVVKKYVDRYCFSQDLNDSQRGDIRRILTVLFNVDIKSKNELLFEGYSNLKNPQSNEKESNILDFFLGEEDSRLRLEENMEFFKDTKEWSRYFKGNEFNRDLVKLFNDDNELFNFMIDSLIKNSPNFKDSNYFDNVRMINVIGKKLYEQNINGAVTVEDYLEEEKAEIEKRIVSDAKRLCTCPQVRLTVNIDKEDPDVIVDIFSEYLKEYSEIVDVLDLSQYRFTFGNNRIVLQTDGISTELKDCINGLGYEYDIQANDITINVEDKDEFLNRIIGILVSPTLHEWVEDDKINGNPNNEHLRTLFFVPKDLKIVYKNDNTEPFLKTSFTLSQTKHYTQNYIQWYLNAKHTTGDIQSLNTVLATWLTEMLELKKDSYVQARQMSDNTERVWKDLEDALSITFNYERFKKSEILKKLLLAVNIEQLTPLVTKDRFQSSLLASSILRSTLDIAKEKSVFKGIMQTSATLRNEFEGTSSITYLAAEEKERVERALENLGFSQSDEGLQMFRSLWINLWYLRGYRGESQTLKVTSAGIEISNPKRTMYENEKRKNETDKVRRKYEGGQDKIMISWSQIRDIKEVKVDLIPSKDVIIKFFTTLASISNKESRPKLVSEIEKEGPGNIILKLPGRDEPLCEIFAVHKPNEFWKLLQDFSKLMVDEEASGDALELLRLLEKN